MYRNGQDFSNIPHNIRGFDHCLGGAMKRRKTDHLNKSNSLGRSKSLMLPFASS